MTAYKWGASRDDTEVTIEEVKGEVHNAVDRIIRRLMKTADAGRPTGSRTIKTEQQVVTEIQELEQKIFGAMVKVFQKAKGETDEFKAEDAITRKSISAQLSIDRTTLYNWTKLIGKNFDDLKDDFLSKRISHQQ